MKPTLALSALLLFFIITQSFQCDRGEGYNSCETYKTDTVVLNASIANPALEYRLYDTIWFSSIVNDNFVPLSGSPAFTKNIEQLTLNVFPYSINTSGSLPTLQYATIEFNPIVREGSMQSPGFYGYNYIYRRVTPNNTLQAGLVAGRTGLFIVEMDNGVYYGGGGFRISRENDVCTSYAGKTTISTSQQNLGYWNQLGVTALSMSSNYGSKTIAKNSRNYIIFKVIP